MANFSVINFNRLFIIFTLCLTVLGLCYCSGFSLVVVSGLLIVVVSLVVEHRLSGKWASVVAACGLSSCGSQALSTGSIVVVHGLSCSAICGIFPDQGLNGCPLHWQVDSLTLSHQGRKPCYYCSPGCTIKYLRNFLAKIQSEKQNL